MLDIIKIVLYSFFFKLQYQENSFKFDVSDGNLIMIRFEKTDIVFGDENKCQLTIGSNEVSSNYGFLRESNFFYLRAPETITLIRTKTEDCSMQLQYTAVVPGNYSNGNKKT